MKITINRKEKCQGEIDWKTLPVGTVVEFETGIRAVRYDGYSKMSDDQCEPQLLLLATVYDIVFDQAAGYLDIPIVKVLGKITEIIVEED